MKKLLYLLLLLVTVLPAAWAQEREMYVASFERFDNDMTARIKAPVIDQNGRKTALIKIETPLRGLVVEGGMLGITETRQETGELWVYLPHGTIRFTLKHKDFGVLRDYEFPEPIVEASTYVLKLVHTGKVVNYIEEVETNQYFILNYTPADALVDLYVDDVYAMQGSDGAVSLKLTPGKHTYRLESMGYKNGAGVVDIANDRVMAHIDLLSSRGKLAITTAPESGAQIYIDGKLIGVSPLTTESYESGSYPLTVKMAQYMPYTQQVLFPSEDKVENLAIELRPNYADITIATDSSSDIYVNEEYKGRGYYTQRLNPGLYTLEARKASHRSTRRSIEVVAGELQQITLDAPTPIYGSLDIMSNPANASVYLNDTLIGTAPDVFSQLLIGNYTLRLEKEGYQSYTTTITLTEGKITDHVVDMKKDDAEELYNQANALYDAKKYDEALPLLMRAVEQEYAPAQTLVGNCYYYGRGVEQDYEEAVEWYRIAAQQGYARAENNLGLSYSSGEGVIKDDVEAVRWWRKAAEQGYAFAQSSLGYCYYLGDGVEQDYTEAASWYRKAAEQGNVDAQHCLGICYELGNGVRESKRTAVSWYRKAAEQGYAFAQCSLGVCYNFGNGVVKNKTKAVSWYRKAAEQGNADAQFNLGTCYEHGEGLARDLAEAASWYRKSAEQGNMNAQYNLGHFLFNGRGVERNSTEAISWLRKAAKQGHAKAKVTLIAIGVKE